MALAFTLPDTDGTPTPLHADGARAAVVVFTCNHCPYALAWHERIQDVARDYADRGVRVLQINPNDAARYPRDSLEAMRARVDAGEFAGPVPVRRDAGGRARLGREDDAGRVRHRRDRRRLPRRAGRRPRRPVAERRLAARGARRRAGRAAGREPGDQAGRLLDQVEVELLCWEGCPSHPAALAELRAALGDDVEVVVREIVTEEQAVARALPGLADDPRRRRRPVPDRRAAVADAAASTASPTAASPPRPDPDGAARRRCERALTGARQRRQHRVRDGSGSRRPGASAAQPHRSAGRATRPRAVALGAEGQRRAALGHAPAS